MISVQLSELMHRQATALNQRMRVLLNHACESSHVQRNNLLVNALQEGARDAEQIHNLCHHLLRPVHLQHQNQPRAFPVAPPNSARLDWSQTQPAP